MASNLPTSTPSEDSAEEVKNFFDKFFQQQLTFPASQVDAVVGYFMKRGFSDESAKSTAIVLLNQSKIDNINVFQLLDTLQGLSDAQLSGVVTEILNSTRDKTSTLGFKVLAVEETVESRNIRP
jgi:hypothetical protein